MKGKPSLDLLLDRCLREVADGADPEQCLEGHPEWPAELEPLLRAAVHLQRAPRVGPSEELASRVWARVRRGVEEEWPTGVTKRGLVRLLRRERPPDWSQPPRRYSMSGIAAAVALIITLMGGSGMVYASQDALPGEDLYRVKQVLESARLRLATSEQARLELGLEVAGERLAEAIRANEGQDDGAGLAVALEAYSRHLAQVQQAAEGFRGTPEEDQVRARLQERLQEHLALLESLHERLEDKGAAAEALERAIMNANRVAERWQERHGQGSEESESAGLDTVATEGPRSPQATEPAQHQEQKRHQDGQGQQNREQNREASGGVSTPPVAGAPPSIEAPSPQPTPEPGREQQAAGGTGGTEPDRTQDRQQEPAGDQQQEQDQDRNQQQQQEQQQSQSQDQQQDQTQEQQQYRAQEQEGTAQQEQQQQQQQSQSQDQQQAQLGAPSDSGSDGDSGQEQHSNSAGGEAAGGGRQ